MAALTLAVIGSWIESLENIDWLNFRSHGLNALRFIHTIPIRPEILHAAARFWDSELHVFRFGIQELCPTVEEFQAYLGSRGGTEPVVPPLRDSLSKILKDKLGVNEGTAKYLLRGNALDILLLFADFRSCGDLTNFTLQNRRMFALCMCLLASYLLVPLDGNASPFIVSVASQIEQRRDVVPMVLAETLMGLDAIRSGRTNVFGGSPLLLQMWLCDKVKLKADPENHWVYDPRTWNNRPFVDEHGDVDRWTNFFMALREEHVVWRCHWLVLPDMTAAHIGPAWVVIAGLTGFAFFAN